MKQIIYILAVVFLVASCKTKKQVAQTEQSETTELTLKETPTEVKKVEEKMESYRKAPLVASIEKGYCFGKCPVYKAEVYRNGDVVFVGEKNVPNIGKYQAQITFDQVNLLIEKAKEANYMGLEDVYDNKAVTDLPTTTTYIYMVNENQKKTIKARHQFPQELYDFQKYFHDLIMSLEMVKVEE